MNITVIDLEFQQHSTYDCVDILQIGAVECDLLRRKIAPALNIYVKPTEPLDSEISDLTGITQEILDNQGMGLRDALNYFWSNVTEVNNKNRLAAWGGDIEILYKASEMCGVQAPKNIEEYNLKKIMNLFRSAKNISTAKRTGLKKTMKAFGLEFKGDHHNALTDAKNTARLLIEAVHEHYSSD